MIKSAIEKVLSLAEAKIIRLEDGRQFSSCGLHPLVEPRPMTLETVTLTSIADFIHRDKDKVVNAPFLIHVVDPFNVKLYSPTYGAHHQRVLYVHAQHDEGCSFKAGYYYDVEEFIIQLQISFLQNPVTEELVKLFSNIRGEEVATWDDDGLSQSVTVRKGVALVEKARIPSPVMLRPYRTFREISQPVSPYIVRMRGQEGKAPKVALFQADGNEWQLLAMRDIAGFLMNCIEAEFDTRIMT